MIMSNIYRKTSRVAYANLAIVLIPAVGPPAIYPNELKQKRFLFKT